MQRKNVLLPEPELPMMLITSPACAVSDTPLSTSLLPKRLWMLLTWSLMVGLLMAWSVFQWAAQAPKRLPLRKGVAPAILPISHPAVT